MQEQATTAFVDPIESEPAFLGLTVQDRLGLLRHELEVARRRFNALLVATSTMIAQHQASDHELRQRVGRIERHLGDETAIQADCAPPIDYDGIRAELESRVQDCLTRVDVAGTKTAPERHLPPSPSLAALRVY